MDSVGTRDAYKLYKKEVVNPVPLKEYLNISQGFTKFLMQKLMNGDEICLPEGLGRMKFIGQNIKPRLDEEGNIVGLPVNWKATNELRESNPKAKEERTLVYFFNEHTSGIRYRFHWIKKHVFIRNKDFYSFKFSRKNKREFAKAVLEGKEFVVRESKIK